MSGTGEQPGGQPGDQAGQGNDGAGAKANAGPSDGGGNAPAQGDSAGLVPLPENATEEQRAEFDKKLRALAGVPLEAKDYGDFGFGDEVKIDTASDDYQFYTGLFHKAGLSRAQCKMLLEAHQKRSAEQLVHLQKQSDSAISEYRAQVKRDFIKSLGGEAAFKDYDAIAERGFKASAQGAGLSDKEAKGLLDIMRDDPRFIKMFHGIGKLFREDVLITGAAPKAKEQTFTDIFNGMFNKQGGQS